MQMLMEELVRLDSWLRTVNVIEAMENEKKGHYNPLFQIMT